MTDLRLQQATLLLVGHGAKDNLGSTLPAYAIADRLRDQGWFHDVITCFYRVPPWIAESRTALPTREVFVVPLTISEGYFTTEVIPAQLGLGSQPDRGLPYSQAFHNRVFHFCQPIGTHKRIAECLIDRAKGVLRGHPATPPPQLHSTALFIAGHGTPRNRRSRKAIEDQVDRIRARQLFAEVHPAFMLESPRIKDCWQTSLHADLVMVPLFTSEGLHTQEDIPVLLGEPRESVQARLRRGESGWVNPTCRDGKRLWYSPALSSDPVLSEVVMERVRDALALPLPPPHA